MRQAGRYLPTYRALRGSHTLSSLFHTPELAFEVTHLPLKLFNLDAAILFSDILMIAEVFGLQVIFPEKGGPRVEPPIFSAQQIENLVARSVEETLHYVFETIRLLSPTLQIPLLGFCGAPFTVATYLVAGGAETLKRWMQDDPESVIKLLDKICSASIEYLLLQKKAGVHAVQIFDSWANLLSYPDFLTYSLSYMKRMVDALSKEGIPTILFCRNSSLLAPELASIGSAAISFDEKRSMRTLRSLVPSHIAIQGNLDQKLLLEPPDVVEAAVKNLLEEMRQEKGFIVNLGHGLLPETRVESVQRLVETIQNYKT